MTVYVDEAIHPWRGRLWCHLFSDDIDELHAFAKRLRLKRAWFQEPPKASWRHYDITDTKRARALRLGAVEADRWKTIEVAHGKPYARRLRRALKARIESRLASQGE